MCYQDVDINRDLLFCAADCSSILHHRTLASARCNPTYLSSVNFGKISSRRDLYKGRLLRVLSLIIEFISDAIIAAASFAIHTMAAI